MNLSHTYAAPKPKSYVGVGLVVALHVAAIYAFSAGLIKPMVKPPEPIMFKPLPPDVVRDPPLPPVPVDQPKMKDVPVIQVPVPIFEVAPSPDQPSFSTVVAPADPGPVITTPSQPQGVTQAQPATKTQVQTPGAVCSVMPQPEMPALNWSGEAVLQVLAAVRGGRVVGTEFRVTQGALDGKTKRALQRSAESALAGYQCQGDATFQQDFAFRVD